MLHAKMLEWPVSAGLWEAEKQLHFLKVLMFCSYFWLTCINWALEVFKSLVGLLGFVCLLVFFVLSLLFFFVFWPVEPEGAFTKIYKTRLTVLSRYTSKDKNSTSLSREHMVQFLRLSFVFGGFGVCPVFSSLTRNPKADCHLEGSLGQISINWVCCCRGRKWLKILSLCRMCRHHTEVFIQNYYRLCFFFF